MEITREQAGTTLTISLRGPLDAATAPQLDAEIKKGLGGIKELRWDFSDVDFMTSAGIRELLIAEKLLDEDAEMKIYNANENVRNALYLTDLISLIGLE